MMSGSQDTLFLGRVGFKLKITFMKRTVVGCSLTGVWSIFMILDRALLAVLSEL